MKFVYLFIFLLPFLSRGQLVYTPGSTLNKNVPFNYYDTDYIYITNTDSKSHYLEFITLTDTLSPGWHASTCTGGTCYSTVPSGGFIGTIEPGEEGYILMNLSTNDQIGQGEFVFLIQDPADPTIQDTIRFTYQTDELIDAEPAPWAKITHVNNILTVIMGTQDQDTELEIFDLSGRIVHNDLVEMTYSVRTDFLLYGKYIARVSNGIQEVKLSIAVY